MEGVDLLLYVVSWSIPLKGKQYWAQTQETQIRLNINRFSKILPNGSQNSQHNKLPSVTLLYSDLGGGMDLRGYLIRVVSLYFFLELIMFT